MEWTTRDKSAWERGPWDDEPDKVQWVDGATGLDCLIVRGPHGALCGYVGVPEAHPWHGVAYSGCTQKPPCRESYCGHSPDVDVHGGLTFADSCTEPTRERWEKWREGKVQTMQDASRYPNGDSAQRWKERSHLYDDFEAWRAWGVASFICHLPESGRPDKVWWFGFDCAHSGDKSDMAYSPEMRHRFRSDDSYRTRAYVEHEVQNLARQLHAAAVPA